MPGKAACTRERLAEQAQTRTHPWWPSEATASAMSELSMGSCRKRVQHCIAFLVPTASAMAGQSSPNRSTAAVGWGGRRWGEAWANKGHWEGPAQPEALPRPVPGSLGACCAPGLPPPRTFEQEQLLLVGPAAGVGQRLASLHAHKVLCGAARRESALCLRGLLLEWEVRWGGGVGGTSDPFAAPSRMPASPFLRRRTPRPSNASSPA